MITSGIIISGTVEHIGHNGVRVHCRAGLLDREVLCEPISGIEVGSEVLVALEWDLRHGAIRRCVPRTRVVPRAPQMHGRRPERRQYRVTHRRRNAGVS